MLSDKTNFHHSKLPSIGEIGYLIIERNRFGECRYITPKKQKVECVAFPLSDNVLPYSIGIHTAFFKNLSNGSILRASGFYFESL